MSRIEISASRSVWPRYIGYFDLDWSNWHVVHTCPVSGQWLLSVYEVLVTQFSGSVWPDPVRLCTRYVESAELELKSSRQAFCRARRKR